MAGQKAYKIVPSALVQCPHPGVPSPHQCWVRLDMELIASFKKVGWLASKYAAAMTQITPMMVNNSALPFINRANLNIIRFL
jgi:hypothetical protein